MGYIKDNINWIIYYNCLYTYVPLVLLFCMHTYVYAHIHMYMILRTELAKKNKIKNQSAARVCQSTAVKATKLKIFNPRQICTPTFPTHVDGNPLLAGHQTIHGQAWVFLLLPLLPESLPFLDWWALDSTFALNPTQSLALHCLTAVSLVEEAITKLFFTAQKRKGPKMLQTQTPHMEEMELITPSPVIHANKGKEKNLVQQLMFFYKQLMLLHKIQWISPIYSFSSCFPNN